MEAVLGERQRDLYMGIGMSMVMLPLSILGFLLFILVDNNVVFLSLGPAFGLPLGMGLGLSMWRRSRSRCEGPTPNMEMPFFLMTALGILILFVTVIVLLMVFI